jgi:hypothetical protein
LSGILAGMMTKTRHLCYVAAFPIPEVFRGINGFLLGAKEVCSDVKVGRSFVRFCSSRACIGHHFVSFVACAPNLRLFIGLMWLCLCLFCSALARFPLFRASLPRPSVRLCCGVSVVLRALLTRSLAPAAVPT